MSYFGGFSDPTLAYTTVQSDADNSTSSTSYTLLDAMTTTPAVGTYMVWFSSSVTNDTSNADIYVSIYSNSVQVANSERRIQTNTTTAQSVMSTIGIVTVNGNQEVEIRWKVSAGNGTAHQKTMMLLKVA